MHPDLRKEEMTQGKSCTCGKVISGRICCDLHRTPLKSRENYYISREAKECSEHRRQCLSCNQDTHRKCENRLCKSCCKSDCSFHWRKCIICGHHKKNKGGHLVKNWKCKYCVPSSTLPTCSKCGENRVGGMCKNKRCAACCRFLCEEDACSLKGTFSKLLGSGSGGLISTRNRTSPPEEETILVMDSPDAKLSKTSYYEQPNSHPLLKKKSYFADNYVESDDSVCSADSSQQLYVHLPYMVMYSESYFHKIFQPYCKLKNVRKLGVRSACITLPEDITFGTYDRIHQNIISKSDLGNSDLAFVSQYDDYIQRTKSSSMGATMKSKVVRLKK